MSAAGNSCRSQIAEGFARHLAEGKFIIKSAGIYPSGVHPMTIKTMKEVGIDISNQPCTMLTKEIAKDSDYLITLCESARDHLPPIPRRVKNIYWEVENPDVLYTSEEARRLGFARVRDDIKKRIQTLLLQIEKGEL